MSKERTKKAVDMLLNGATMVSDPCPYCKGVRVIKDGNAFCIDCGRDGNEKQVEIDLKLKDDKNMNSSINSLDEKIKDLTNELYNEKNPEKQQQIIRSINEIITIKEKLKNI